MINRCPHASDKSKCSQGSLMKDLVWGREQFLSHGFAEMEMGRRSPSWKWDFSPLIAHWASVWEDTPRCRGGMKMLVDGDPKKGRIGQQRLGRVLVGVPAWWSQQWERSWLCPHCGIHWWILHWKFSSKTHWVLGAETSFQFWTGHFSLFFIFNIGFSHSISHLLCSQI